MTTIDGHGNFANNTLGKHSRTNITNTVNVLSSSVPPRLPPGQVTVASDREFGPRAGWYLAATIVALAADVLTMWRGLSNFKMGFSDTTSTVEPGSTGLDFPSPPLWVLVFFALLVVAGVFWVLFWTARNEAIPISTGRLMQHRHIGGSESHRLRAVRTRAICPSCRKTRSLRLIRVPVAPSERTHRDGSVEWVPPKWNFVAQCRRNSSHEWSIDRHIVSRLVEGDAPTVNKPRAAH